ncbi:MAG: LLM class flavin-dependent oxidoreductase [Dehalococcoidia bacterium]
MAKGDKLRFGIAIPQMFPAGRTDSGFIVNFLRRVESLGYDSVWVQEQILGVMPTLDPIPLLSYASAFSGQLKLGTAVLLTPLTSPIHLAKSLATLDQLCNGRLIVGVGIGGYTDIYPAFGISTDGRARRFEEGIQLLKMLWTEERVTFQGRFWQMEGISINPKPLQRPHPPIWFGAHARPALKRAVKMGDGWMGAGSTSTKAFKEHIRLVRQYLQEEGKGQASFPLSKRVYVAVDRDKEGAARKLQEWFGRYYGNPALALEVAVFGSEEECIEGLGEIAQEGVDMLMLNPVYDMMEQAERLAQLVLPKL